MPFTSQRGSQSGLGAWAGRLVWKEKESLWCLPALCPLENTSAGQWHAEKGSQLWLSGKPGEEKGHRASHWKWKGLLNQKALEKQTCYLFIFVPGEVYYLLKGYAKLNPCDNDHLSPTFWDHPGKCKARVSLSP